MVYRTLSESGPQATEYTGDPGGHGGEQSQRPMTIESVRTSADDTHKEREGGREGGVQLDGGD